jgi:aspartyl-tRNA(Asn)/glutamyl-tRNA(Gln) amidotransferase subunit A
MDTASPRAGNGDLAFLTAAELSRRLQAGEITSRAIVERLLERIAKYDGKLHAFIALYADEALEAAEGADRAIASGHGIGPFHGVPIALKDIIEIEGRVTTGGSKPWSDRVSPVTATLAQRLVSAGMIVLGKTHTVEFAMGAWGTNEHMGTPWNPWDLDVHRTPGGSSAGSGVAVAAGLAPWAIGTDTGGSVRLPAAWCGLTGLKTTIGRISTHGVMPLANSLDTPGPMCRSVEDAALLYGVLAGPDPKDPRTLHRAVEDPMPGLKRGVAGLKLARLPDAELAEAEPEIRAAYEASLQTLADLGAEISTIAMPRGFADFATMTGRIIGAEGYLHVGEMVDDMDLPVDPAVRPRIWVGKDLSARDYLMTLRDQQALKAEFDEALEGIDALMTPTTATPPIPIAEVDQSTTCAYFTRAINLLEMCAVTLPNGFVSGGLPSGLQIACRGYDEALALRIAWAYEQASGLAGRHPPGLEE